MPLDPFSIVHVGFSKWQGESKWLTNLLQTDFEHLDIVVKYIYLLLNGKH